MSIILKKHHAKYLVNTTLDKELLTYLCGYYGNLVIIAGRYVADAYCPREAPCQI